jgi:Putative beta-barrel porin 2
MKNVQRHSAALALSFILAAVPTVAAAFEAIDTIPWPSLGSFPAYPREADRPVDVWLNAGVERDDNVLRVETNPRSDTITRLGGGARYEQRIVGRQRLRLEARGDYYKYNDSTALDHFAYAVRGDWLWEVGNNLSGALTVGHGQRQVDMSETQVERLDLVKETRVAGTAAYLVMPGFRVRGGLAGDRADRKEATETDTRALTGIVAAEYVSPLANTIGLEYRNTNGEAPVVSVDNNYREREIALVAIYALGTQLRAGVRLGRTQRDYDQESATQRNFDGNTGRISLDWLPGNKTILGFEAYREPRSVTDIAASHVLLKGVAFGPRWAVTNQVVLSARFVRERRVYEGDSTLAVGGTLRDELYQLIRFAVGWEPQRRWQLGLGFDHGERESNIAGRDYQVNVVTGNLAYVW